MRLIAALDGSLVEHMADEARIVAAAGVRAVRETTNDTKTMARGHVTSKLGRRAGYLLTSKVYENGPGDAAGLVYSRWKHRRAGPGGDAADILAAHAHGAVIEPRQSKYLYIPLVRGRLSRRERRIFQEGAGKVDIVPIGRNRFLVVERRRRGRGRPLALLVPRVELRARLQLDPIYRQAERDLRTRLVRYLNADAA